MVKPRPELSNRTAFQVVVVGGGLTGLALACALASAGVRTALVERNRLADTVDDAHDGRVTAVAQGSKIFLESIDVWNLVEEAQSITRIAVEEGGSPLRLDFDCREVGADALGWIVHNRHLRRAMVRRLQTQDSLTILDGETLLAIAPDAAAVVLELSSGTWLSANLLCACEGRRSVVRELSSIEARIWDYDQIGLVCTIRHETEHQGLAIERFFEDGPFAILPMTGGNRSSIVWAARTELADALTGLSDAAFAAEIESRFGDRLGSVWIEGRRFSYPLSLVWADPSTGARTALVGDTAHGIHPIAGQGWNLALRDVAALAEIVVDRIRLGLDPGDRVALEQYETWRSFDTLSLVAVTDGINRLFANDLLPVKLARNLGLGVVQNVPSAKRFFMRHAMGRLGELPRTMRSGGTL